MTDDRRGGNDEPTILLTNDDGIDATGLQRLRTALETVGDVVVVAPAVDHSGIGRVLSYGRPVPLRTGDATDEMGIDSETFTYDLPFEERDGGYAVEGTPCDCAIIGINALDERPDLVVSGCNPGANVGVSALGRSGTVSAAMEAAYLGVPGIAVSAVDADEEDPESFDVPARFTVSLVEHLHGTDAFDAVDYLNVLVPTDEPNGVEVTRPTADYEMDASHDGDRFRVHHRNMMRAMGESDELGDPDTDRHAIHHGRASITPLTLAHAHADVPALREFAAEYE